MGKRFGNRWVFRGLDFSLQRGDRLVILGPNGAGKSTLLRTLAGLVHPTEGLVKGPDSDPSTTFGVATLEMALYPALTCAEHLELAADLRGCPARTDELLNNVGLAYAASLMPTQMSTGMKARLKLALALQPNPAVLLLDEPGASLDEEGRALVSRACNEQAERGVVVLATNDPSERRLARLELVLG